jgi:hypothetical protein
MAPQTQRGPWRGAAAVRSGNDRAAVNSAPLPDNQQDLLLDAPSVSLQRQLEAIRREIKLRRQVYPQRIATRRMSARKAAEEIAVMQAIEATLLDLIAGRRS